MGREIKVFSEVQITFYFALTKEKKIAAFVTYISAVTVLYWRKRNKCRQ